MLESQAQIDSAAAPCSAVKEDRWSGRPALSAFVRLLSFMLTICASIAAVVAGASLLPQPVGGLGVLAWWLTLLLGSALALVAADRLARRTLLPLAALLQLSLVFPGRAPSRARVAFRVATVRNPRRRLEDLDTKGLSDDPFRAAVMVIALVGAMTSHCRCTRGHSERVRAFGDLLADELRLSQQDKDRLRWAALLHDVGKLHVSPRILDKPGSPTSDEWQALKRHPEHGARIAAPLQQWLGPWADAIEQHHERWDGGGYPGGLAGEEISLGARVVAVADAFDVMTTTRPYQRPISVEEARQELARSAAGTQFDPAVVRAFLNIPTPRLRRLVTPVAWAVQLPALALVPRIEVAAAMARETLTTLAAATAIGVLGASGAIQGDSLVPPPPVQVASPPHMTPPAPPSRPAASVTPVRAGTAPTPRTSGGMPGPGADQKPPKPGLLDDQIPVSLPELPEIGLGTVEALIPDVAPVDVGATLEGAVPLPLP